MRKLVILFAFIVLTNINLLAQSDTGNTDVANEDTLSVASEDNLSEPENSESSAAAKEEVDNLRGAVDGLNESYLETKSVVDALKKIKLSGYIQTQFQSAETDGAKSFAGGDFPSVEHNRYMIRRGRIKFNYDNDLTQYILQFDVTEKGLGIKDAFVSLKEPWLRTFGLTAGVFDRPFGFEISYSSSLREAPERTRIYQTLFPGERDLGAKIEIFPAEGPLSHFNFKGGLFAGNGPNPETDNAKDFIGRLGFTFPFEEINFAVDGGISGYFGQVRLDDGKKAYALDSPSGFSVDSTTRYIDRQYIGGDIQLYYDLPVIGGFSIRGEYITGKNPGAPVSTAVYKVGGGDLAQRNFSGYYINYVQNLGEPLQLVVKYDVFDPNSDVMGNDITGSPSSKLTSADLKYSTLGLGIVYHWDANVKFIFYYDMVTNEKVNSNAAAQSLLPYKSDIKDNVFTVRMQFKF